MGIRHTCIGYDLPVLLLLHELSGQIEDNMRLCDRVPHLLIVWHTLHKVPSINGVRLKYRTQKNTKTRLAA